MEPENKFPVLAGTFLDHKFSLHGSRSFFSFSFFFFFFEVPRR